MGTTQYYWESYSDEKLLSLKMSDLGLSIKGTPIEKSIQLIYSDFKTKKIPFRPHFWISEEFFSPATIPGVAVPFYLAHPRLLRLEKKMMYEAEGEKEEELLKILRHEVGHAIDHAYRLNLNRERQKLFGLSSKTYPKCYSPKPYSKSFVLHLDLWYAQSHPDEDFAETFAVWFTPEFPWQKRYNGWPALRKLLYVDRVMTGLSGVKPKVTTRIKVDPLEKIHKTLKEFYDEKRKRYGVDYPNFYDRDLRRLFSEENYSTTKASSFIKKYKKDVRKKISYWTSQYQYTIDQVLEEMIARCDELKLTMRFNDEQTKSEFLVLLTVQTMNFLHSDGHKIYL